MEIIESGLIDLVRGIRDLKIKSIALPPIGCGLGGLDWTQVKERIEQAFADLSEVQIVIFEPQKSPVNGRTSISPTNHNKKADYSYITQTLRDL